METHLLGQICALLAALTWATSLVLFKRSGETVSPLALNLFKNVIGIALLALTLAVCGGGLRAIQGYPAADFHILIVSGVLGIALADTLLFHSLNRIGVGILSIVDCLYSPFVIALAALLLSETLALRHYVGGALIVAGVLVSSRHEPPPGRTRGQLIAGILLGVLAIILVAVGIVIAKPVLEGADFPIFWATTIRMVAGTAALVLMILVSPARRECWAVFRPAAVWKVAIPGAVLGTYLSMIFWVAGFKYTYASLAGILNQTSVIFAMALATFALREPLTPRKVLALGLALSGIVLVTVVGSI
jgi:drug/metabolite transporter (DMT)-like permease